VFQRPAIAGTFGERFKSVWRGLAPREWRFSAIRAFERLVSPTVQVMNSTCLQNWPSVLVEFGLSRPLPVSEPARQTP